jgi:hydrogenase-1 operon protein HyaE
MTIATAHAVTADAAHPLVAQLAARHGFAELSVASFDAWADAPGRALVLFTEDPVRYKETLDLAVIAPELVRAFPGVFRAGVLLPEAARAIAVRYGFRRWPALVVLDGGGYVGAIDGLRNWNEYLNDVALLATAPVTRPPSVGIAVHCPGDASVHGAGQGGIE